MRAHRIALLLACTLLAACGGDKPGAKGAQGEDGLPKPAAAGQSVTGMPDPGVANAPPMPATVQAPDIIELPEQVDAGDPAAPIDDTGDAQQAVSALHAYYAAINARDYATAYAQWSDGGNASGQSPEQFAAGFAGTEGVSVEIGAPGRIEGAAGSRYIEIPVTLEARQGDGSVRRYAGNYALRRSVVDGATPEQQAWRIASADLRELTQ